MPEAFYNMVPRDYYAMVEGYNLKQRGEMNNFRTHAFITIMPNLKEGYSFDRFCTDIWPLPGDEKKIEERILISEDQMQQIFKAHNLIKPKEDNV